MRGRARRFSLPIQRAYDLLGRLTALTYPDATLATYTYNNQGGLETVTLGSQAIVSNIDYNAAGQMVTLTSGNGVISDCTYNPQTLRLDRLLSTGPGGTLQDFAYQFDAVGNVSQIQDGVHTGSQTFQYDALNRLTQASGAYGTFTYAYDAIGNLVQKEGVTQSYGAGPAGPHAVTSTSAGVTLAYDLNGNLTSKTSPASSQALRYDAENRLVEVTGPPSEQTVTLNLNQGWNFVALPVDPSDRSIAAIFGSTIASITQISRQNGTGWQHWVNSPAFNQFTELTPGVGYQIHCKQAVTLTVTGTPVAVASQSLAAGWHLLGATNATGALSLASWLNGLAYGAVKKLPAGSSTLSDATQADAGQAYWVQVTATSTWTPPVPPSQTTTFVYDGDGGRVKQTTASGTTLFLGQSYEKSPTGTLTKYVFAGDQRLAAKDSTGAIRFYHGDHLGSSNVITDGTGALVELSEHTPYGSLSRHEGTANVPQKFTGQRLDASTGLYFYNSRYYDPDLGRFTQPDTYVQEPADPQTLNRYAYVRNNPVNFVDPSGYGWFRKLLAIVFTAIAAVATEGASLFVTVPLTAGAYYAGDQIGAAAERSTSTRNAQAPPVAFNLPTILPGSLGGPMGLPSASALATGNPGLSMVPPPQNSSEVDTVAEQVLDYALIFYGVYGLAEGAIGLVGSVRQATTRGAVKEVVDVFRVEGYPNTRIHIDATGNVSIADTQKPLFLNFGQPARATEYFQQKVRGGLQGASVKSFKVPGSFLEHLRETAVTESKARAFPNNPFIVDATRVPDQFGLRAPQIKELLKRIIPGSGKSGQ